MTQDKVSSFIVGLNSGWFHQNDISKIFNNEDIYK